MIFQRTVRETWLSAVRENLRRITFRLKIARRLVRGYFFGIPLVETIRENIIKIFFSLPIKLKKVNWQHDFLQLFFFNFENFHARLSFQIFLRRLKLLWFYFLHQKIKASQRCHFSWHVAFQGRWRNPGNNSHGILHGSLKNCISSNPERALAKSMNADAKRDAYQWIKQIVAALSFNHDQRVVHRDLTLDNI